MTEVAKRIVDSPWNTNRLIERAAMLRYTLGK